jgi:cytochrome c
MACLAARPGTHAGFSYSDAMKAYGQAWTYDGLYNFLKNPGGYIDGTSMSFAGIKKAEDRIALVDISAQPFAIARSHSSTRSKP